MDILLWLYVRGVNKLKSIKGEFGVGSILSIAIALIVSAFILVPQMRSLATTIMTDMTDWWNNTMEGKLFPGT